VGDVDGRDALAEVLEAVAGLLSRDAGGEQLREIVRELGVLGQQLIWRQSGLCRGPQMVL